MKPSIYLVEEEEEEEEEEGETEVLEVLEVGVEIPEDEVEVEEELPEWETVEDSPFKYGDYTLYTKEVTLREEGNSAFISSARTERTMQSRVPNLRATR